MMSLRRIALGFLLTLAFQTLAFSQNPSLEDLKQQAARLVESQRLTEALPLLRELAAREPSNSEIQYFLGFAWAAQANNLTDEAERKAAGVRARESFIRAKELGSSRETLDALISSIAPDGTSGDNFSENVEAQAWMIQAEAAFGQGKMKEALQAYQKALELDPGLYEAALFSGDVYLKDNDFAQAEKWYQKAIEIDPTRETAYRYSATPFLRQGQMQEALARYVEAYITEPYSRFSQAGIAQWGRLTNTPLAHPTVEIPVKVSIAGGQNRVEVNAASLNADDGSSVWIAYGGARVLWSQKKFAETFPLERTYRHSLAEEADALRSVLVAAAALQTKTLAPSLTILKRLDDDGFLEAYILMARPDEGIAQDHAAYLKENRDKLRRYVLNYVVTGGGK